MPSLRVKNDQNCGVYFLTMTVKNWYYIFDRHQRWLILLDSIKFCQENKNLKIYSFVFMMNHIHLIIGSNDVSGFIRDFKKYTSFELMKNINNTEPSISKIFTVNDGNYQIWENTNTPKLIESENFFNQKVEYINYNPVKKDYVVYPEDWKYSSAAKTQLIKLNSINNLDF